jgi:cell wall-associated NlpC family hydrolase
MTHKDLKRGDHIYANYGGYTHHGIYCGDGKVIHYGARGKIRKVSLKSFAQHHHVSVQKYDHPYPADRVVSRAKKRLGEKKYDFLFNNCEYFATWCKVGRSRCRQLENPAKAVVKLASHHGHKVVKKVVRESGKSLKFLVKKTTSTVHKTIKSIF